MDHSYKILSKYLTVTFAITYTCWGFLALCIRADLFTFSHPFGVLLHMAGGFGPLIAALLVGNKSVSFKELLSGVFKFRKNTHRYLAFFAVFEILVIAISSRERNVSISLSMIPIIFLQATFLYGGNEEPGWRGVMQPLLEKHLPFPTASLVTGSVWGLWHIPLWFVDGASQQNIPFLLFFLLGIFLSFFFAAVYRKTGAIFSCCVLHGLTNTLLSVFVVKVNAFLIIGLILMLIYSFYLWYSSE